MVDVILFKGGYHGNFLFFLLVCDHKQYFYSYLVFFKKKDFLSNKFWSSIIAITFYSMCY